MKTIPIKNNQPTLEGTHTSALVIPYYNGKYFIDRCINSVINQSEPYSEVIIVNDGSNQDEAEYLQKFISFENFKILNKENGGQGSARNFGVAHATTKYISFLDQDDFLLPNHNSSLKANLIENLDKGYCYADAIEADGDGNIFFYETVKRFSIHPKNNIYDFIAKDCFILPSAMMITKEAFNSVGGFDSQFTGYEDDDLSLRLWRKGYKGFFLDMPVYVWCMHSASTSFSIKMSKSRIRYIKKLATMFPVSREASRFIFRDLVFPRFKHAILADLSRLKSISCGENNRNEYIRIYDEFIKLSGEQFVNKKTLIIFRMLALTIIYLPSKVRAVIRILYKAMKLKQFQ